MQYRGAIYVSSFYEIGKKTTWAVWRSLLHGIFARLSNAPSMISSNDMEAIKRYVVLLYQRTSTLSRENDVRKQLFAFGNRKIENVTPTFCALEQHVKRAVDQAGHIWGQSLIGEPLVPSPKLWRRQKADDGGCYTPCWTFPSEASIGCQKLIKCGCKKSCTARCKCVKAGLQCTQLCYCSGQCDKRLKLCVT